MAQKQLPKPTKKTLKVAHIQDSTIVFGPQGQRLIPVIHDGMCDTETVSAGLVVMSPLKVAKPHFHPHTESILYFAEGWAVTLVGEELEPVLHGPGDLVYIPENLIHTGINLSDTYRVVVLEIRTDPHFTKDIVILPEYEERVNQIALDLQAQFKNGTLELPHRTAERSFSPYLFKEQVENEEADTNSLLTASEGA